MSMLGSALDELTNEDLDTVTGDRLEADVVELARVIERAGAELLRRLAKVDTRRSYQRQGILSTTAFLVRRCGMAGSTAREKVRVARALQNMPRTATALAAGDITYAKARHLATARTTDPATFARDEETLVDSVSALTVRETASLVAYWRQAAAPDDAEARWAHQHEQRRCHVSSTFEGTVAVDAILDPTNGQTVMTAINTAAAPADLADARASGGRTSTPAQRRADALTQICRHYLDTANTPTIGGEKPHISVVVDLEVLEGRAGKRCETGPGGVITPEAARMLACDAKISRIITRGSSQPLDVGRATRTVPAALRRALNLRDGGCVHPDCDRPPEWCDAHHKIHWVNGGPTALWNLELRCRPHHTAKHQEPP